MGLAASQARFLAITSRKMNCEFQSMQIAQQKLSVTRDLQKAAQDYQSSLNATKLIWDTSDTGVYDLSYDIMMNPSVLNEFDPFFITDVNGRIVLTKPMFQAAVESGVIDSSGNPMGLWVDKRKKLGDSGYITRENGEASGKLGAGEFKEVYNSDGNICGYEYANKDKANDGSRNAFLYQLGKVNKIDMNMADNIINLGEAGYTKSGIGGKIYSKNSANAMNTFALKEYMKTADYSMRLASGNSIPKDKTAHDLVYGLNILSILNDSPPVKSEFGKVEKEHNKEDGWNYVENPEDLDAGKFVITKNGQALSATQAKGLTLGDLLDGKYDITIKQNIKTQEGQDIAYENGEGSKTKFELILYNLAKLLGYDTPSNEYVGLNVDKESEAALNQAYDFTSLALTTVTNKSDEGGVLKLCNIAEDQNNVIYGKNGLYSLSLSNLMKSFLTNFAVALEGFESPYNVKTESQKESHYVTNDPNYRFIFKDEEAMTDTLMLNADFYNMLYNQIATCGACTDEMKQEMVTDNEWLQQQLKRGTLFISSLNTDGYYYQGAYTLNGHIQEVTDENAIAMAELEYNVQKSKLNTKEESLELQMKNLDMEISSLTTEYDTVKNLISKSIEKVFTMFST